MDVLHFATKAMFLAWADIVAREKPGHYNRPPASPQKWIYADGHVAETHWGKRNGAFTSTMSFVRKTGASELEHSRDAQYADDIDRRGGVMILLEWQ